MTQINERLKQKSLEVPAAIEKLLLNAANDEEWDIPEIIQSTYPTDLNFKKLKNQLSILPDITKIAKKKEEFQSIKRIKNVRSLVWIISSENTSRQIVSDVEKLLRIFLTISVTTATAECSFSALNRIKTYLHSSMVTTKS